MAPMIPGLGADRPARRMMLVCLSGQRRLRTVTGGADMERWARANARRGFVVEAPSADAARSQVEAYIAACARNVTNGPRASEFGILEAWSNPPGGPGAFPSRESLSTRARGPTSGGAHPL